MSSEALLKHRGHQGNVSPAKCSQDAHGTNMRIPPWISGRGNGQRALGLSQYGPAPHFFSHHRLSERSALLGLFWRTLQLRNKPFKECSVQSETDVINWQERCGSSSDGSVAVAAVTQRRQLFYCDRLQMPPGQGAKINTSCSVTGMQQEHYTCTTQRASLNRAFNFTSRQTETPETLRLSLSELNVFQLEPDESSWSWQRRHRDARRPLPRLLH